MIDVIGNAAPTQSEQTEMTLRKVLKDLDPLLDVKWVPVAAWNALQKRWEGRYSLTVDWPQADGRWQMVQSGEVNPADAHDIVGWLCTDMSDGNSVPINLDGIESLVLTHLGKMDNTRYPWKQRFMANIEANKKHRAAIKAEAVDQFMDEAEYQYRKLYDIPLVQGGLELNKSKEKADAKSASSN